MISKKYIAAVVLTLATSAANASLISVGWKTGGDNLLTIDSATNLQWLDLSQTFGMTVAQVVGQLGAGQQFSGFQLATATQVHGLMGNAGLPFSTSTGTISTASADILEAHALTTLLSDTLGPAYGSNFYGSRGLLDDNGINRMIGFYVTSGTSLRNEYFGTSSKVGSGVWLVRQALPEGQIPEPTSLALLGLGLAALAFRHRNRA